MKWLRPMALDAAFFADKQAAEAVATTIGGHPVGSLGTGRAGLACSAQAVETQKLVEEPVGL